MEHRTDTMVDEQRGVRAYCWTCEGPIGPQHGKRDGMGNTEALLTTHSGRPAPLVLD